MRQFVTSVHGLALRYDPAISIETYASPHLDGWRCAVATYKSVTLESLFRHHVRALRSCVERRIGAEEAEDVVQETYLHLLERSDLGSLREPRAYLFRCALNLATDTWRKAQQQALDWLIGKHSGTWSEVDQRAFEAWLFADPTHREEYEAARALWQRLERFKPELGREREAARRYRGSHRGYRSSRGPRWALGLATVLFAMIVGLRDWGATTASYETRKGERQWVTLADGSTLLLNTDTVIEVRFASERRAVTMMHGEAFFTVVHEADRPFEVAAGGGRIRDLGTRFNVYAEPERVAVAVLEGGVEITTARTPMPQPLEAGQSIAYDLAGALSSVGPADAESLSAWQIGKLIFRDHPLAEVLDQVSRYHSVEFLFADPELKKLKISGTFNTGSLLLFLRTLEAGFPVEAQVLDAEHIRLSRGQRG